MIDDLFRKVELKNSFRDAPGKGLAPIKDVSEMEPHSKPRTSSAHRQAQEQGIE